jgi:hypothetical protein
VGVVSRLYSLWGSLCWVPQSLNPLEKRVSPLGVPDSNNRLVFFRFSRGLGGLVKCAPAPATDARSWLRIERRFWPFPEDAIGLPTRSNAKERSKKRVQEPRMEATRQEVLKSWSAAGMATGEGRRAPAQAWVTWRSIFPKEGTQLITDYNPRGGLGPLRYPVHLLERVPKRSLTASAQCSLRWCSWVPAGEKLGSASINSGYHLSPLGGGDVRARWRCKK